MLEFIFELWFVVIFAVSTLMISVYYYLTWNFDYWEKRGIPSDKPRLIYGTISNPFVTSFETQDIIQYRKFYPKKVYGIYEGRNPVLVVADPELLKKIFVKDFNVFRNRIIFPVSEKDTFVNQFLPQLKDDEWRFVRNIVSVAFTTGKLKKLFLLINECTMNIVSHMEKLAKRKEIFDMTEYMAALIIDITGTCAFGIKIDTIGDPDSEFVKLSRATFSNIPKSFFYVILFPFLVDYLPSFISMKSIYYFRNLLGKVIAERLNSKQRREDFLQILLDAAEKSENDKLYNDGYNEKENTEKSFVFTRESAVAQSIIFLLAGLEGTTYALSFAFYSLINHEDVQDKLLEEIDAILHKHNGLVTYESISDMLYLDMVVSETLRLYPPMARIQRTCEVNGYNLNGIDLKKGATVAIPMYCIHHDEQYYPNPYVFDPERFSPENRQKRHPYTYMPFGHGPRNCVGNRLALMEIKQILVNILQRFRVRKCSETKIPFEKNPNAITIQIKSLKVILVERNQDFAK